MPVNKEVLFMVDYFSVSALMKDLCGFFQNDGGYEPLFIQLLGAIIFSYLGFNFKFHVMMEIKKSNSKG